MLVYPQAAGR